MTMRDNFFSHISKYLHHFRKAFQRYDVCALLIPIAKQRNGQNWGPDVNFIFKMD